tara:strand:+ start:183 stop:494 length:312 start_codon:yes stop_codon:yes gene_type:complete
MREERESLTSSAKTWYHIIPKQVPEGSEDAHHLEEEMKANAKMRSEDNSHNSVANNSSNCTAKEGVISGEKGLGKNLGLLRVQIGQLIGVLLSLSKAQCGKED